MTAVYVKQFNDQSRLSNTFRVEVDYDDSIRQLREAAVEKLVHEEVAIIFVLDLAKRPGASVDYRKIADEAKKRAGLIPSSARQDLESTLQHEISPEDRAFLTGESAPEDFAADARGAQQAGKIGESMSMNPEPPTKEVLKDLWDNLHE